MADEKEKKQSIFREKSLEAIESPDRIDDYLRVTSPGVWVTLSAVIVLLIGAVIWGIFGHIDSTTTAAVVSEEDGAECLVPQEALEAVLEHRTVTVNGEDHELNPSVLEPQTVGEDTDVYVLLAGNLKPGDIVYPVDLTEPLEEEGVFEGTLVTETLTPISLLFGN